MKVYKFGGASVKDAHGVKQVVNILKLADKEPLLVVVSAMGKTTNALEQVVRTYLSADPDCEAHISEIFAMHLSIAKELFEIPSHPVFKAIAELRQSLSDFIKQNKATEHAFVYDQIVPYGELLSTTIVSHYCTSSGIKLQWLDVRQCIKTDTTFREGVVDWTATQKAIKEKVSHKGITLTQGFLGSETKHNFTTTLGREGSDYTAAIFAYCLNALSVTIWKDVPGVLSADPRYFNNTVLIENISYSEAIELAFYGASVIHPKTLQPLQRKEIPLFVKPFNDPVAIGTRVGSGPDLKPLVGCIIKKEQQVLLQLSALDFNFIMEDHIGDVFKWLHTYQMKVELIQNSAISFSVCVDNKYNRLSELVGHLQKRFQVVVHPKVTLLTFRHASLKMISNTIQGREVLLRQESGNTLQLVLQGVD
jgi:aspartate kinase